MPDDDDDIKFTEHEDGSYEWTDSSGAHGSVTRGGSTVTNPDGSGTAMDTKGNETTWDADGNFDGADPYARLQDGGTSSAGLSQGDGSADDSYDPYADLPSSGGGAGLSASGDDDYSGASDDESDSSDDYSDATESDESDDSEG